MRRWRRGRTEGADGAPGTARQPWWRRLRGDLRSSQLVLRLALVVAALILFGVLSISTRGRRGDQPPLERFAEALEQRNLRWARTVYFEELHGEPEAEAEAVRLALEALERMVRDYGAGRLGDEQLRTMLEALGDSGIGIPPAQMDSSREEIARLRASRVAYEQGRASLEAGQWRSAMRQLSLVSEQDGQYNAAQLGLEEARQGYREARLAQAQRLSESGERVAATQLLGAALELLPGDAVLSQAYEQALSAIDTGYRSRVLDEVDGLERRGELPAALSLLESAQAYLASVLELPGEQLARHPLAQSNLIADQRILANRHTRLVDALAAARLAEVEGLQEQGEEDAAIEALAAARSEWPQAAALERAESAALQAYRRDLVELIVASPTLSQLYASRIDRSAGELILWPAVDGQGRGAFYSPELPLAVGRVELTVSVSALDGSAGPWPDVVLTAVSGEGSWQTGRLQPRQRSQLGVDLEGMDLALELQFYEGERMLTADELEDWGIQVRVAAQLVHDPARDTLQHYRDWQEAQRARRVRLSSLNWLDIEQLRLSGSAVERVDERGQPLLPPTDAGDGRPQRSAIAGDDASRAPYIAGSPSRWRLSAAPQPAVANWEWRRILSALRGRLRLLPPAAYRADAAAAWARLEEGSHFVADVLVDERLVFRHRFASLDDVDRPIGWLNESIRPGQRVRVVLLCLDARGQALSVEPDEAWQLLISMELAS